MKKRLEQIWKKIKPFIGWEDYLAFALFFVGILGFFPGPIPYINGLTNAYHEIRTELISIGVTVLIIENANQMRIHSRSIADEKKRLILQMGSPDNAFAVEAARQLRSRGWLSDGTLSGARLYKADLSGAFLIGVDLSTVNLWYAKLCGAVLLHADLSGAILRDANLGGAALGWADLSRADLRAADLSEADLRRANLSGTKYNDCEIAGIIEPTKWPSGFDPKAAGAIIKNELDPWVAPKLKSLFICEIP